MLFININRLKNKCQVGKTTVRLCDRKTNVYDTEKLYQIKTPKEKKHEKCMYNECKVILSFSVD